MGIQRETTRFGGSFILRLIHIAAPFKRPLEDGVVGWLTFPEAVETQVLLFGAALCGLLSTGKHYNIANFGGTTILRRNQNQPIKADCQSQLPNKAFHQVQATPNGNSPCGTAPWNQMIIRTLILEPLVDGYCCIKL